MTLSEDEVERNRIVVLKEMFAALARNHGTLPETYVCIDIETSGMNTRHDHILQIGHCLVVNRKVEDRQAIFLDWSKSMDRTEMTKDELAALESRTKETVKRIREKGKACHTDWDRLLTEGQDPYTTLRDYAKFVLELKADKAFMVMHNGYHFDCRFLSTAFSKYAGDLAPKFSLPVFIGPTGTDYWAMDSFWFPDNSVLDTGVLLKAAQINYVPKPNETLRSFATRVCRIPRKGVFWSLNEYAVPHFGLDKKYNLSAEKAHDAGYDSYCCHLLLEELRERANQ